MYHREKVIAALAARADRLALCGVPNILCLHQLDHFLCVGYNHAQS